MKTQIILVIGLIFIVGFNAKAVNGTNDPKQQQTPKKELKPKYDFNIFKFFSIPTPQIDTLKPKTIPSNKKSSLFFTEKKNIYLKYRKSLTI